MSIKMKIYLVGGAVRDLILKIENHDMDYVVVDSSVEEMLSLGYEQVGKSFPVFLNNNGDQYALARREISTGVQHQYFKFEINKVSLKDDLFRRDLTINSIAMDDSGNILDFFGGINDLKNKRIRHVSDSFKEDPLRIFRVARFSSKFNDFTVAKETIELMKRMVIDGAVSNISKERIYEEFNKAIVLPNFFKFLEVLNEVNALENIPFINFNKVEVDFIKSKSLELMNSNLNHIKEFNLFLIIKTIYKFNKKIDFKVNLFDKKTMDVFKVCFDCFNYLENKSLNSLIKLYNQKSIIVINNLKIFLELNEQVLINETLKCFTILSKELSQVSHRKSNINELISFKNMFFLKMVEKRSII